MKRLALLLLAASCTDSEVYTVSGAEPYRPDRIAVTGRLCTEDTTGDKFPVKVLLMVDQTNPMAAADPDGYRFCGAGSACAAGSIERLVARNRNSPNVSFGFVGITNIARAVTPVPAALCTPAPCDAQQFFPARDIDMGLVQAALSVPSQQKPDVLAAIAQAQSFITADMARSTAGAILRTRYIVYMLLAAPPAGIPPPTIDQVADDVKDLKEFVYSRGALEFRLHTGLLYFGPQTIDLAAPAYNCYSQGDPGTPCACGSGATNPPENGNYCAVWCPVRGNESTYTNAAQTSRDMYRRIAFMGDGNFSEFNCAPQIDFQLEASTSWVHLMRKDIIAYNMNVKLSVSGPAIDSDGDGLTDDEEVAALPTVDRAPLMHDIDGDGLSDRLEFRAAPRQDPTDPQDRPAACVDPSLFGIIPDSDLDLLNDCEEGLLQTSASIPDTDGDGLPDALEFFGGTVPTAAEDRLLDFDGDGITNAQEVIEHTNPRTNDGRMRGAYGYRSTIADLGRRTVAQMADAVDLRAVSFRSASPNVLGGAALLRWNAGPRTLEWCDTRHQMPPPCDPIPTTIDQGTGTYTLFCQCSGTGEQISIEVFVVDPWLPADDTTVHPLISVGERNCYDVRISNIKLLQTQAAEGQLHIGSQHQVGTNHILIFFTQAPEDRLDSPGISKVTELRVTYQCSDPENVDTCARSPADGFVEVSDSQFAASLP